MSDREETIKYLIGHCTDMIDLLLKEKLDDVAEGAIDVVRIIERHKELQEKEAESVED